MKITVKNVYDFLDELAPFSYADKFDNVGLMVGDFSQKVEKVILTLDITRDVVDQSSDCDLIISHHPVIFHPLKSVPSGSIVHELARNSANVIAFHTNYDMTVGGISDLMAEKLGLENLGTIIEVVHKLPYKQLLVYVPKNKAGEVYTAMTGAGAGSLGNYRNCAFFSEGEGRFMPATGASPYVGKLDKMEKVSEVKIETLVKPSILKSVVGAMRVAHPYEEPAYQICDNLALFEEIGYGRICRLEREIAIADLAEMAKKAFDAPVVKFSEVAKKVKIVAVGSGASGSLYCDALAKGADALITGEIKQDQWVGATNLGISLVDVGHYHSENFALGSIKRALAGKFPGINIDILTSDAGVKCI